jgi:hypothetical protein
MNYTKRLSIAACLATLGFAFSYTANAADSVKHEAKEAAHDTKKSAKKAYRSAKDKTCEMVNGKLECAAKSVKHKTENTVDEVKDRAND